MPVFAGQGDPARSMALLWRTPSARTGPGPKPGLSVDAIVAAAIAVADTDGLAGLSMRAVAERLGVTAMALYTYVPGKDELLDLMYDGAHAELPGRSDLDEGWRSAVASWATDLLGCYVRHPWALHVATGRPPLGPGLMRKYELELRAVDGLGLSEVQMDLLVTLVNGFVRGTVGGVQVPTTIPINIAKAKSFNTGPPKINSASTLASVVPPVKTVRLRVSLID